MEIKQFTFDESGRDLVLDTAKGKDWPVVYMISNTKKMYVGETTSAATRMGQHLKSQEKKQYALKEIRIVFDDEYNKSVILDYEQKLIKSFQADGKFDVINKNEGQSASHNYYDRKRYENSFANLWEEIRKIGLANDSLSILENKEIFKYSPYNALNEEQNTICAEIINDICSKLENNGKGDGISLVNGCAGTGKTVLAISLINLIINATSFSIDKDIAEDGNEPNLTEKEKAILRLKDYLLSAESRDIKIGFVLPMTSIRGTLAKVFKKCGNGLSKDMVIGPYALKNKKYDILLVDESHRLTRRHSLGSSFHYFDNVCDILKLDKEKSSELDWILKQSKYSILFYDEDQSIKGADITHNQYMDTLVKSGKDLKRYYLTTQMRCKGGDTYVSYIKKIFRCEPVTFTQINNYDFKFFNDVDLMINEIKKKDTEIELCKTVAGYSWEWTTNPKKLKKQLKKSKITYDDIVELGLYDIDIQEHHYIWNLSTEEWIARPDSHDTIGCIHTTQGYDLNYVGVIFGKEIDYDPIKNEIVVNLGEFCDSNVKSGCDNETVKKFIVNTYTTMLARGIKGCYVFVFNENLRDYLKKFIAPFDAEEAKEKAKQDRREAIVEDKKALPTGRSSGATVLPVINTVTEKQPQTKELDIIAVDAKRPDVDNHLWVPILGSIAAGFSMYLTEYADELISVSRADAPRTGEDDRYFVLQVSGDSMIDAGIYDGDYVLFKRTKGQIRTGDIVACRIDDDMATLKKLEKDGKDTILVPFNKKYKPLRVSYRDFEDGTAGLIGKMIKNLSRD